MAHPILLAFALLMTQGKANQAPAELTRLDKYIESLHWDASKSGTLIAIDADKLYVDDNVPVNWAGFERKMVKAGGLSVLAQNWAIALDDSDLPNPYQALSDDNKLMFLLATISSSDLAKLTGSGLSPRDLSGEQKLALLSIIPRPLTYLEGESFNGGFRSSKDALTLPDEQREQVKIQLRKGVDVSYDMMSSGNNGTSWSNISSLSLRGPDGTPIVRSGHGIMAFPGRPELPGHLVDSKEKKSELAWNDPQLSKSIELKSVSPIGEIVNAVREQTGVEIYADARIASLNVNAYGGTASASDLLRGLALAVGGVIRQVGPAYVLTADLEGSATRETRLGAHLALGHAQMASRVTEWNSTVDKRQILAKIGFPADDPFQGGSISADKFNQGGGPKDANYVSLSDLPGGIQAAISEYKAARQRHDASMPARLVQPPRQTLTPIAELAGKVLLYKPIGWRLVLPDGRPLESHPFGSGMKAATFSDFNAKNTAIPCDPAKLPLGSAVGIRSEDAATVAKLCGELKSFKIPEVWLDSQSPSVIRAAIDSGLLVDLVIHPWRMLKGESNPDIDRNLLGLTGSRLNAIPEARFDPMTRRTDTYADSFSPAADVSGHLNRLVALIPKKGIHRLIVLDIEPNGYQKGGMSGRGAMSFGGGRSIQAGLMDTVPEVCDFGYTTQLRLEFLRKHQIDPIDLKPQHRGSVGPPIPFFDGGFFGGPFDNPYHGVYFPRVAEFPTDPLIEAWHTDRHTVFFPRVAELVDKLTPLCGSIFLEGPKLDQIPAKDQKGNIVYIPASAVRTPQRLVKEGKWDGMVDWKTDSFVNSIAFNPVNTEDDQGELVWRPNVSIAKPFCFDLGDVPANRFLVYLRYLFNSSQ